MNVNEALRKLARMELGVSVVKQMLTEKSPTNDSRNNGLTDFLQG